jgi:hypothetical protein
VEGGSQAPDLDSQSSNRIGQEKWTAVIEMKRRGGTLKHVVPHSDECPKHAS